MPKLAAKDRSKVENAPEGRGDFKPLEPGKYIGTLEEVEARVSGQDNAYWNCTFSNLQTLDGESVPGKQWYMIMLPIDKMPDDYIPNKFKAKGTTPTQQQREESWEQYQGLTARRIKDFFDAFGFTPDSDTDEMYGDQVVLQIGVETISRGAKAGQLTNRVNAVLPLDSVEYTATSGGGSDDEF